MQILLDFRLKIIKRPTNHVFISCPFGFALPYLLRWLLLACRCLHFDTKTVIRFRWEKEQQIRHSLLCSLCFHYRPLNSLSRSTIGNGKEQYSKLGIGEAKPLNTPDLYLTFEMSHRLCLLEWQIIIILWLRC